NLSSTTVTGSGTAFTSQLNCNGTRYLGFLSVHKLYKVVSCADDTHLTITPEFGSQGEDANISGSTANAADKAWLCRNTTSVYCGGPDGNRDLSRLMPGITGWLYNATGTARYKAWGDNWFSNAFGGPANGPGGLAACGGPGCDGQETDWMGALPSCLLGN